jgi:hypothetical protein
MIYRGSTSNPSNNVSSTGGWSNIGNMWDQNVNTASFTSSEGGKCCLYNFGIKLSELAKFNSIKIYTNWYGRAGHILVSLPSTAYAYLADKRYLTSDDLATNTDTNKVVNILQKNEVKFPASQEGWANKATSFSLTESSLKSKLSSTYGTEDIKDFL